MHHHQAIASDSTTIPPGAFNAELDTYRSLVNNDSRQNQNGNPRNRDSDYDSLLEFPKSEDGEDTRPGNDDRRQRLKSWGWELSSCVLSLASFFAIIAVLFFENGKPLEQWSWRIGPTAVVSFITTIAKSSMLLAVAEVIGQLKWNHFHGRARPIMDLQTFDSAGRGPLGAAVFVGKNHIKTSFASIAAMVVILSLLVDPFMQLIFAFPTHSRHDTGLTASFKSATIYDPHSSFYNPNRFGPSLTDSKMQSAIISTIGGQTTPPIAMCTSGNCTWASIATLGVCSACMNVTLQIEVECPRDESANLSRCYYTFPSGGNLSAVAFTPGGAGAKQPTRWNSSATFPPSLVEGSPMENETAALASFNAIQIVGDGSSTALLQNPIAWQCALAFCEKIYRNVTAENGLVRFPASDQGILSIMEGNACDETQCYTLKTNSSPPLTTYKVNTQDYPWAFESQIVISRPALLLRILDGSLPL
ncbi:hypothetical protein SAMD00023353_0900210 [Rosellinia necatrix]|uniref:Uncharacterized protein n=1 Tax=Rosellinia necatrix TaxID=77044 RepID=A0A1W2THG6_ROSNE|nr:hypothetical protein SAMD00023353_0900210 [Rosellinia necatrix]